VLVHVDVLFKRNKGVKHTPGNVELCESPSKAGGLPKSELKDKIRFRHLKRAFEPYFKAKFRPDATLACERFANGMSR
jgi:hypothetical protein